MSLGANLSWILGASCLLFRSAAVIGLVASAGCPANKGLGKRIPKGKLQVWLRPEDAQLLGYLGIFGSSMGSSVNWAPLAKVRKSARRLPSILRDLRFQAHDVSQVDFDG